ncbi:TetR/AcrR family transcriptional regulator [Vibrio sp. SCSIO 43135]|uniref:TetR/AcrR family transcriptional regulator n=1 Tax=Vibrio sp. SCSIO 43135 TaxID=2819096 RepID=UPI002075C0EC|nr:TetR/AcrR family transcriptional regulator [Vibrio sp. SCSIO 43135]USD40289.1 TetR/AcrR family transcriptional regulator [Vibrio sp. SCSIO 43135]
MSKKRQLLIDTALELFYTQGINSIGINEVLKVSGVAKKTLYSHFESKDALILAALEQRHSVFIQWLESKLADAPDDESLIRQLFGALDEWFHGESKELGAFRGCFFINTSAEFSQQSPEILGQCQLHKQQVKALLDDRLQCPSPLLLDTLCTLKEGAISSAHVSHDRDAAKRCIEPLLVLLSSVNAPASEA